MRKAKPIARLVALGGFLWLALSGPPPAAKAEDFPVIFNSPSKLRSLGISLNVEELTIRCYYYGDGGYTISVSDGFYERFKRRGFSVAAMCLGLVSQTRYDPETGRRLPTYILVDQERYDEYIRKFGKAIDGDAMTYELPLDLPDCFKNANPYTDCRFRFGRISGRKLMPAETETFQRLGAAIDKAMSRLGAEPVGKEEFFPDDGQSATGFRVTHRDEAPPDEGDNAIPEELKKHSAAWLWVRADVFKRGYGYGLDASGGAGPDINPAALASVMRSKGRPQIDVERLREILEATK